MNRFIVPAVPAMFFSISIFAQQTVHLDNTIVVGNQCTGVDCTTSESFGFDIHRYKENILRIHFDDMSTGTSPKNDWRLIINDVSSGGDEYFAIEDATAAKQVFRLEAGAPLYALTVAPNGNLGLGTDEALQDIHIVSANNPGILLEQDTSGGGESQVWEISGNDQSLLFKDHSNAGTVPFRIAQQANENSLVIDTMGNIGIGMANPGYNLQVAGNVDITGELTSASDQRLKKDIEPLRNALHTIALLRPVSYHFRNDEFPDLQLVAAKQMGFIAQEVEKILPELVKENTTSRDAQGRDLKLKSVNYIQLIPLLAAGLKEQQQLIEHMKARIGQLEKEREAFIAFQNEIRTLLSENNNPQSN